MDKHQEYINFIKAQMLYFDTKSIKEKKRYRMLSIIALVANALLPILATFSSMPSPYKQIVASLSAVAAIANGLSLTFEAGTTWKHYRNTFTDLETVLRAYNSQAGEYKGLDEEQSFELFYAQCEEILHNDRDNWSQSNTSKDKK